MKRWDLSQLLATIAGSAVIWMLLAGACLMVGSTGQVGWPDPATLQLRLEPILLASLVGASLASAGMVYQAVLRNPLADPYLLGISSGASLFAYLWQLPFMTSLLLMMGLGGRAIGEQSFAFLGAIVMVGLVFTLANRRGRLEPITLLLVGVIVNAVNGSVFLLLNAIIKDPATTGGPLAFIVGGLQTSLTIQQKAAAAASALAGWMILMYVSGLLNVAGLSDSEAESLGVRIHRLRWLALIVASLVTASAVAVSGPIGFVGLVCPHLARLMVGSDQRRLLPISTALGAGLLAIADAASRGLARQSMAQTALPVGVLTGLLGGPFFLFLLWRNRTQGSAN